MPRKPRFMLPDVPLHVVQRGHNRSDIFFNEDDRQVYLDWLQEAAAQHGCQIHAYVLMSNHVHLLATPGTRDGVSAMMQYVGRRYVPYFNRVYGRSGTLWEGRFRASLIDSDRYLLRCMRYIELNPVRAHLVRSPAHYRWSSYRANAQGRVDSLITPHPLLNALADRHADYRALFAEHLGAAEVAEITAAWQSGTPLGGARFLEMVEGRLKQKVGHLRPGRPPRSREIQKGI